MHERNSADADAIAVTTCAEGVPPSSRAESPAKSIIRLWATAPKKRKPRSEVPKISSSTRARKGVMGG